MSEPPINDANKCLIFRKKSKLGQELTRDEFEFCHKMFKRYPEWYSQQNAIVFNDTVPFFSEAKYTEREAGK